MPSTWIKKLEHSGFLADADRETLRSVIVQHRDVQRGQDLIREGDRPENVFVVLDGYACRYKMMPQGRRHIMALLVPGDFCDLHVALLKHMDHGICTLSDCEIAEIPRAVVEHLTENHPRITRALWWATLTDEAVLREWLANMGQRDATRQMAHLFYELLLRLQVVGHATDDTFDFPITQNDLADVLGLSVVHANRSLQELRGLGLIVLRRRQVKILNVEEIKKYCGFNANYLHLELRANGSSSVKATDGGEAAFTTAGQILPLDKHGL